MKKSRWSRTFGTTSAKSQLVAEVPARDIHKRTTMIKAVGLSPVEDRAPGPVASGTIGKAPFNAEALVLRAALEDCLCHLVELYGPDMLDPFLERCLRRSIAPVLSQADVMDDAAGFDRIRLYVAAAELLLREAVESVRKDPTPPEPD